MSPVYWSEQDDEEHNDDEKSPMYMTNLPSVLNTAL